MTRRTRGRLPSRSSTRACLLSLTLSGCVGEIGASSDEPGARAPGATRAQDRGPPPSAGAPGASPGVASPGVASPGVASPGVATPGLATPGLATPTGTCVGADVPMPAPVRRLTRPEYNNTVRDLLGDATRPADVFPAEVGSTEFGNDALALDFSRLLLEQYFNAAKTMAERATTDAKTFASLLGCDPVAAGETPCATTFVRAFGQRVYRRPLDAGERDRLLAVYRSARADTDFRTGIATVLRTMLQAPQFLYRAEVGLPVAGNANVRKLDHFEIASRLSYLLWGSMPDPTLFTAAHGGRLGTKTEILTQARRMLGDTRAHDLIGTFHGLAFKTGGIAELAKDRKVFPRWTAGLGAQLAEETRRFVDDAVWNGPGNLAALLTSPTTFMNADVAKFYGVTGPKGPAFEKVTLDPARAAGFMTQAGVLASLSPGTQTNPVQRGYFIRAALLCAPPPSPPSDVMAVPPKPQPGQTTRQSFAAHSQDAKCVGCHILLDPLGFAFESFDAVGLLRTIDQGNPIDTSGELTGTDVPGRFTGAVDLMARLARSADVRRCYVAHWYSFGYGRGITDRDACGLATLDAAFVQAGGKVSELVAALTQIDAFMYKEVDR